MFWGACASSLGIRFGIEYILRSTFIGSYNPVLNGLIRFVGYAVVILPCYLELQYKKRKIESEVVNPHDTGYKLWKAFKDVESELGRELNLKRTREEELERAGIAWRSQAYNADPRIIEANSAIEEIKARLTPVARAFYIRYPYFFKAAAYSCCAPNLQDFVNIKNLSLKDRRLLVFYKACEIAGLMDLIPKNPEGHTELSERFANEVLLRSSFSKKIDLLNLKIITFKCLNTEANNIVDEYNAYLQRRKDVNRLLDTAVNAPSDEEWANFTDLEKQIKREELDENAKERTLQQFKNDSDYYHTELNKMREILNSEGGFKIPALCDENFWQTINEVKSRVQTKGDYVFGIMLALDILSVGFLRPALWLFPAVAQAFATKDTKSGIILGLSVVVADYFHMRVTYSPECLLERYEAYKRFGQL